MDRQIEHIGQVLKGIRQSNGLARAEVARRMVALGDTTAVETLVKPSSFMDRLEDCGIVDFRKLPNHGADRIKRYLSALDLTPQQVSDLRNTTSVGYGEIRPLLDCYQRFTAENC